MPKGITYPMIGDLRREYHISLNNREFDFLCGLYVRQNFTLKQAQQMLSLNLGALGKTGNNDSKVSSARQKKRK